MKQEGNENNKQVEVEKKDIEEKQIPIIDIKPEPKIIDEEPLPKCYCDTIQKLVSSVVYSS